MQAPAGPIPCVCIDDIDVIRITAECCEIEFGHRGGGAQLDQGDEVDVAIVVSGTEKSELQQARSFTIRGLEFLE